MACKVQTIGLDLINNQATVVAFDTFDNTKPPKMVQTNFPFDPAQGSDHSKAIAAAKIVLQQAINEI
jgi:hypothetical protein